MKQAHVAIEVGGEISTGEVVQGAAEVGETVEIELRDENGNPVRQTGTVVEVL